MPDAAAGSTADQPRAPRTATIDAGSNPLREPTTAELARLAAEQAVAAEQVVPAEQAAAAGQPVTSTQTAPNRAVPALARVVPAPAVVQPVPGTSFTLAPDTTIRIGPQREVAPIGAYLAELLRPATGYPLSILPAGANLKPGTIYLVLDDATAEAGTGMDGYRLTMDPDAVTLTAARPAGLFHGVQTLRQLLPAAIECTEPQPGPWTLPGGRIEDAPRFAYRGAMLDVSRHFFDVLDVLRIIDHLARYKINHLHLHLTDDQGWRIAVDSWPRLGPVGGSTQVGGGPGGYYSKADYRRIVAHAAARYITVVPEIDLPGHTNAALTAYGELAPNGVAPAPYTGTEVGFSALNLASDRTYAFVADVVREIAELTPGPYLHIGGDEAFKVPPADYAAFVDRVQAIVAAHGKTVLGWHQIAPAAHRAGRILQYWGTATDDPIVADAVRRGARLILSPGNHTYLDMKYAPDTPIGHDWAGMIDVRRAYDWDPGGHLAGVDAGAVLGVEAPLWTETVTTLAEVEFMLFPRLPAIAELGWSPAGKHDWGDFAARLAAEVPRWTTAGITVHPAPELPWPTPVPPPEIPSPRAGTPDIGVQTEAPSHCGE